MGIPVEQGVAIHFVCLFICFESVSSFGILHRCRNHLKLSDLTFPAQVKCTSLLCQCSVFTLCPHIDDLCSVELPSLLAMFP